MQLEKVLFFYQVLIETYWNVNSLYWNGSVMYHKVLIETYWNVNITITITRASKEGY